MKNLSLLFSSIKNGYSQNKIFVLIPTNKLFIKILILLYKEGYINGFFFDSKLKKIKIFLKYSSNKPVLHGVVNISKSSHRQYKTFLEITNLLNNGNFFVVSTIQGLFKPKEIIFNEIGGEVLFIIKN